ncbi:MAG: hypothetical protein JNL47_01140 [Bacteroidia bacterium]|nr:hypothetical protein [Bacteroidia bacterium]
MNNEQFDRILHSKLAGHQVVPPPEVWAGIEKKRTNRKGFFRWMAGLVMVFITAGLLFLLPHDQKQIAIQSENQLTQDVKTETRTESVNHVPSGAAPDQAMKLNSIKKQEPHYKLLSTSNSTLYSNSTQSFSPLAISDQDSVNSSTEITEYFPVSMLWLDHLESDAQALSVSSIESDPSSSTEVPGNLSLLITAGPLVAGKQLDSKFGYPGDEKYIQYRNEAELRNSAWSASVLLQVDLSRLFFIRTGINYTSISEKIGMRYIQAQIDGITTDTIVGFRNENTDPTQLLSVSEAENYKLLADYTLRDKAEYRFLSFPIMAGVTLNASKFSFYASAGLALNFSSTYSGKILAPDSAYLFSIQDVSTSPFNKVTGFTFMSAAGIGYRVTDKIKLLFEPSYFRQLPDITKTEYRLSQRFGGYGIQAGVIYKL